MLFKTALAIFTLALSVAATPFNLEPRGKPCSGPTGADDCEDHFYTTVPRNTTREWQLSGLYLRLQPDLGKTYKEQTPSSPEDKE
ncbi:hypothetical protein MCOR02_006624 [Pyricularia oryzae]|uniref:Uncharacterized protein n=1 Tax=Pyricularia oryzae TaxID=318829 RepID=A0A4P7NIZ7_PYROR|nr:hypothetical protein MCOR02_006624 [Pyricularia oryzae]KAI6289739.1 hypothetical protein MCOR34_010660 [Pyricularia oryzae]KAI6401891.1 hypothetical protein MCOR24_008410 [Pyricularia oryzae]KAI6410022.1 hypothetical protein MCOR20_004761 [Pyricularia oryzae]QBZ61970.1 hypothetical protein PoMZ_10843 [Pyricularia oryzae]